MHPNYLRPRLTERELEHRITHPDFDLELDQARKYRFVRDPDTGLVFPLKTVSGGSGLTGTWGELIYGNTTAGTPKNTFTSEFSINDVVGMGAMPVLPAYFFNPGRLGQAIRVVARGIQLGTGSTPPTWLFNFRLNPVVTPANPPTGPIIAGMPAAITGTTTASTLWEAEFDAQFTIAGAPGNSSTIRGLGCIYSTRGFVSPFGGDLFGGGASPGVVATVDYSLLNTLTVGVICGTSLAANQMTLLQLLVFGLN